MFIKKSFYNLVILLILLTPLVSANGLNIHQTELNINKTYQVDYNFELTITNEEPFKFFNVTFKEDDIVLLQKFDLESGETKNVTATIIRDEDYLGKLTIVAEYETTIGISNKTEVVEIDYDTGFDRCNLNLVKGDKITWINNVLDEVDLTNAETGGDFATILEGESYTKTFSYPEELDYYATRIDLQFTQTCTINVMDDEGLVHNSEHDDVMDLDLNILYNPTTLSTNFLTNYYTIEYSKTKDDLFKITNTGLNNAKNIHLSGEWFYFTKNNFDLEVGESTNIGYTIDPEIWHTNETNKNYTKTIQITGNFDTINQEMSIYIPYAKISDLFSEGDVDEEVIRNFFKYWCLENPDDELCKKSIISGGGSDQTNYSLGGDALRKLIERQARQEDEQDIFQKMQLEIDKNQTEKLSSLDSKFGNQSNELFGIRGEMSNLVTAILFIVIFMLFIICGGITTYLLLRGGVRDWAKRKIKMHRGERLY